ncbi:MAG: septum formation initiator family protein [Firmicutes bacterium]|nr:septum formation initiator family protein [Bacillota bacterium]
MRKKKRSENMRAITRGEAAPKKRTRFNGSRLAVTVFVGALVVVLLMSVGTIFSLRAEQKALKEKNSALLLEKESLQDELENVSDKEYIEEQARIQLKLIKPGEILYILEEDKKDEEKKDEKKD